MGRMERRGRGIAAIPTSQGYRAYHSAHAPAWRGTVEADRVAEVCAVARGAFRFSRTQAWYAGGAQRASQPHSRAHGEGCSFSAGLAAIAVSTKCSCGPMSAGPVREVALCARHALKPERVDHRLFDLNRTSWDHPASDQANFKTSQCQPDLMSAGAGYVAWRTPNAMTSFNAPERNPRGSISIR